MPVNRDWRDLFAALNAAEVEYLLVGGHAFAIHAAPRFTKDLDIWVRATPDNARKVASALKAFGAPPASIDEATFAAPNNVLMMGIPPNRIDILTTIDGVTFDEAWPDRLETHYGDQPVHVIGRAHLRKNKLASARPQDLLDVEALDRNRRS